MIHTVNLYCTFTSLEIYNYCFCKLKNYVNSLRYNLYSRKVIITITAAIKQTALTT